MLSGKDEAFRREREFRPKNNFHCFRGSGLGFWRALAMGMMPIGAFRPGAQPAKSPDGRYWELKRDQADGFALKDGGIKNPSETEINPGNYYRFIATAKYNTDRERQFARPWWIDQHTLGAIIQYAARQDYSLARTAQLLLIMPDGDCAWLCRAFLQHTMKAFVGVGNPATGFISPDSAKRKEWNVPVMHGEPSLAIKQYFVPGDESELRAAFVEPDFKHVIKQGVVVFPW